MRPMFFDKKVLSVTVPIGFLCLLLSFTPTFAHSDTAASCAQSPQNRASVCFIGEYDLTFTPDVGASLVLNRNQRFEWYYASATGKKFATGSWTANSGLVTLTTDQPSANAPVFELVSQEAWNETAEQRLRLLRHDNNLERTRAECPVFVGNYIMSQDDFYIAAPSAQATATAAAALKSALAAKLIYEGAVAQAVAAKPDTKSRMIEIASKAQDAWNQAGFDLAKAYQIAGMSLPIQEKPNLPSVCRVEDLMDAPDIPASQWLRGISINIDNASDRFLIADISAAITYDDRSSKTLITGTSGLAFAPFDPARRVTSITLSSGPPHSRTRQFRVSPVSQGVFNFIVNGDLLNPAPFAQLNLRANGTALISSTYMPGRYVKVG